jgi:hypothetical protein
VEAYIHPLLLYIYPASGGKPFFIRNILHILFPASGKGKKALKTRRGG